MPKCHHLRQAELYLVNGLQLYYINENSFRECLKISKNWYGRVSAHNLWGNYTPRQIRISLGNLLHAAFRSEEFDGFMQTIQQLKNIQTESVTDEVEIFRISTQYELLYLLNNR